MEARFKAGDRIRVRAGFTSGHCRTPAYVQGKTGRIETVYDAFNNPEPRAYGGTGLPKQTLYLVRFSQTAVWDHYPASSGDSLCVDLYEHWLEPA